MKKLIAILFASLFAFALVACDGGDPAPTGNTPAQPSAGAAAQDIYFAPNGVKLEMGAAPAPALEALGEPNTTLECPSCALKAKDVDYTYNGFKLTVTYPEEGGDYITGVKLLDDTYTIPGGVTIGSTLEDITAAYGTDYEETNGFYKYTQDLSTLTFAIVNGQAAQIIYAYDFENA